MTAQDDFYIIGGTLPLDADSYIVRQADTQLFTSLRRGDFCYVLNTRQMGKSSLMIRTARRLKAEGYRVAVLDLTAIGQNVSAEQWYFGLLLRTANQIGHAAELTTFWKNNRELGPMQRFMEAIHQILLIPYDAGESVSDLVIFVDEIDAVLSLPFSADEFFAGIRACYNRRSQDATFERLTFCLLGVASPTDLVQDTRISPFNIGQRIELRDFTPAEAEPLSQGLHRKSPIGMQPNASRLLRHILHWTGGHPYMTQRLCQATATDLASASDTPWWKQIGTGRVDTICRDLFLSDAAQETDDNLTFVRNRLLRSDVDVATLLDFYLRIRRGEKVYDDNTNPLCSLLRLSGVVAPVQGLLRVRNRIYSSVFSPAWVQMNLPGEEVRRQRRAYQQGIWRAATAGGIGVLVFATLAAVALDRSATAHRASQEARNQEAIARTRLSRIYVDTGVRLMEEGDYGGALSPLAEAMTLDKDFPDRLALHRRRFASLLARTPQLDNLWCSDKPIRAASYSPDRKWIVTAGEDGWAHVRAVATGAELPLQMRHDSPVLYAAFRPDGKQLITCAADGRAFIWDLKACRLLHTLRPQTRLGQAHEATYAAWSQNGQRVALSCGENVSIWEMKNDYSVPRLILKNVYENAIYRKTAFSPNGTHLASIAGNYHGWCIAIPGGKEEFDISIPVLGVNYNGLHAAFSKDGRRLLVAGTFGGAGQNAGACVFDTTASVPTQRGRQLIPLLRHELQANYATFSPDEKQIATASSDGTARVWDATTGKPITPPLRHEGSIVRIEFSADGRRVVTASSDGTARIWDAVSGDAVCAPLHHAGAVMTAQFGSDSNQVFTASRDGTARLWTLPNNETVSQRINQDTPIGIFVSLSADGERLAANVTQATYDSPSSSRVRVYDMANNRFPLPLLIDIAGFDSSPSLSDANSNTPLLLHGTGQIEYGDPHDARLYSPLRNVQTWDIRHGKPLSPRFQADWSAMNHAGTLLLLGDRSETFHLVDAITGKPMLPPLRFSLGKEFYKHFQPFTPDDHGFVLCDSTRSIRLFDTRSGHPLGASMKHNAAVSRWTFSPDGRYLFTWTDDHYAHIWNVADGTLASAPIPEGNKNRLQFSPDGRYAIMVTSEGNWLWHLDGSQKIRPQKLDFRSDFLVFSPDSKKIVALDQEDWLWSAETFSPITTSFNYSTKMTDAVFSPDSRRVFTVRDDGMALIWDVDSARPVTPLLRQKNIVRCAFSEDGKMVATGGADGVSRVWDANTGEPITPPLRMRGRVRQIQFSRDGRRLITAGPEEGYIWNLPNSSDIPELLQARAQLLSGQRIDATLGSMPLDTADIQSAWKRESRSNRDLD